MGRYKLFVLTYLQDGAQYNMEIKSLNVPANSRMHEKHSNIPVESVGCLEVKQWSVVLEVVGSNHTHGRK